jgi:ABC-type microcin C transport system duplicated ATPase subunit YejF
MKEGKLVEYGKLKNIYESPEKKYTKELINSAFEI